MLKRFEDNRSALAKAVGVSQPTVTAWAQGDSVPTGHHLELIARLLGLSEHELRKGVVATQAGAPNALDVALMYWPGRWPEAALAEASKLRDKGESHSPQGWTIRLDELASKGR